MESAHPWKQKVGRSTPGASKIFFQTWFDATLVSRFNECNREVIINRANASTLLSSAFIRGDLNGPIRGPFIRSLFSCPFFWRGVNRRKELRRHHHDLKERGTEFWITTTLKLLNKIFGLRDIFSPNLRILSRKNNEQTPFILFRAMTVITSTSDIYGISLKLSPPLINATTNVFAFRSLAYQLRPSSFKSWWWRLTSWHLFTPR